MGWKPLRMAIPSAFFAASPCLAAFFFFLPVASQADDLLVEDCNHSLLSAQNMNFLLVVLSPVAILIASTLRMGACLQRSGIRSNGFMRNKLDCQHHNNGAFVFPGTWQAMGGLQKPTSGLPTLRCHMSAICIVVHLPEGALDATTSVQARKQCGWVPYP